MCGRYASYLGPHIIRQQLEAAGMDVDYAPDDDDARETYNFPPGAFGLVYRADVPDYGAGPRQRPPRRDTSDCDKDRPEEATAQTEDSSSEGAQIHYRLQSMKWGLIPSWMTRKPDYQSMMKTINCRDDSLTENRGIWNSVKRRKRCIVICQGFYEWLKKGKEKVPHYVRRKDGQLMCFAGFWDCTKFEDSEEKLYTYTVITTDSNKQLKFLHDRMPVIFDLGSEAIRTWLDPKRVEWNKELQSLLTPFEGELDVYPVSKDVGKVGNNSPSFIIPINSKENKNNIANFFGNQQQAAKGKREASKLERGIANDVQGVQPSNEDRHIVDAETSEHNAPLPATPESKSKTLKREFDEFQDDKTVVASPPPHKAQKLAGTPLRKPQTRSTVKHKVQSAPSKNSARRTAIPPNAERGTQKITKFFGK
ncbi:DUF159 domain protein [Trichodelitschia bisporula]|uniref:DUF159 domain protein n=1 Tax=Trichodelitschia bisporula TaxID=703511 RepID=A0A6G1I6Q7_9PEZI|nr:DUF159 domain protein [Trichodelitschia bisporula]